MTTRFRLVQSKKEKKRIKWSVVVLAKNIPWSQKVMDVYEYTCLNADFCDFTVPAYRREPLPFAALVGWINVQNCSHCSPH